MIAENKETEQDAKPAANVKEAGHEGTEDTGQQPAPQEAAQMHATTQAEGNQEQEETGTELKAAPTTAIPLHIEADGVTYTKVWLQRYPQPHKHRVATSLKWEDIDQKQSMS